MYYSWKILVFYSIQQDHSRKAEINSKFFINRVSDWLKRLKSVKFIFIQQNRLSCEQVYTQKLDFAKGDWVNRPLQHIPRACHQLRHLTLVDNYAFQVGLR